MAMNKLRYRFPTEEEEPGDCERSFFIRQVLDRGINASGVLHFEMPPDDVCFTDTPETYLRIELRVVRGDGSPLQPTDQVFLTPGSLQALFKSCTVSLNGRPLPPFNHYSHAATLISYVAATKSTRADVWSALSGWEAPLLSHSQLPPDTTTPLIYTSNMARVAGSRLVTLYGRVMSDFLMSAAQFIPPGVRMDLAFTRQPDAFSLVSPDPHGDFRIELRTASLFVKRVQLREPVRRACLAGLSSGGGGLFRYNRLASVVMPVPDGSLVFRWNNAWSSGPLPHSLYLLFLTQKGYYGSLNCLSNFFETAGVRAVRFAINGRPILPEPYTASYVYHGKTPEEAEGPSGGSTYELDTRASEALGPFLGLTNLLGCVTRLEKPVGISYNEFLAGCTTYALALNTCGGKRMEAGALDIEVEFAAPTVDPLICLCFGEMDTTAPFDAQLNLV